MVKYPIIFRTSLAIVLGLLAVFVPFVPLKIILGISALIVFAINMRRYAAFLIVISVIFAIVVAIRFAIPYDVSSNLGLNNFNFGFPMAISSKTVYPNMYIQGANSLSIDVTGLDLVFDPSTNTIYVPSSLEIQRNGNSLDISYPNSNNLTFKIVVGTKDKFTQATFHTTGLKVNGNISAENITFNSVGIDMNSSITARTISLNGIGIDLNGTLNASSVEINGTSDKINLGISANTMKINGVSIDGNLKYIGKWTGSRSLFVNSVGGDLSVYTPSSNQGYLDIQNLGGFLKINRVRY